MMGAAVTAAIIGIVGTLSIAVGKAAYNRLSDRIDNKADSYVEDRVDSLEDNHEETRRLAETTYMSVYGDDDRPTDHGFIQRSEERWDRLEEEMEDLNARLRSIERAQRQHQEKIEAMLDTMKDQMDVSFMTRGPSSESEGDDTDFTAGETD
jgi:hypothetical protein